MRLRVRVIRTAYRYSCIFLKKQILETTSYINIHSGRPPTYVDGCTKFSTAEYIAVSE
eukprot:SAG31_NODE_44074_length_264_cov_0.854545_1_plen_57_part_10